MTRFAILMLVCLSFPLGASHAVYYTCAEPHRSLFYSRTSAPLADGYRALYDREFRLQEVNRLQRGAVVRSWKYRYDRQSRLIACERHDGAAGRVTGWDFDPVSGRVVVRTAYVGQGAYNRPWRVYRISYDRSGRRVSEREMVGDTVLRTIQYTYHPGGEVLSRAIYSLTGYLQERTVYRTDDAGRITEELHYQWGRLAKVYIRRYSREGCLVERRERQLVPGDPTSDPLAEPVKPLTGPGG